MNIKVEINSNTIPVDDFNTPTFTNGQIIQAEINKEIQALCDTLDKLDLVDM